MNKINISIYILLSVFSLHAFSLTLTKMQITAQYFDGQKVDYNLDSKFKDFEIPTKLPQWKCQVINNLESAKMTKNKFFAEVKCSVNDNSISQGFSCGEDLEYESFNLHDKKGLTIIKLECVK